MNIPSKLLDKAVDQFATLPGIGRKTALRLALHLLKQPLNNVRSFSEAILKMREEITFCKVCNNIAESDTCEICSDHKRNTDTICVVEDMRDIIAIENTRQYFGLYHVLGGHISPVEGIGPADLSIDLLIERVKTGNVKEVIFALSATMEGDTTSFYIYKRLQDFDIKTSVIARGIPVGDELEYTDEITLGRSLINRTPYNSTLSG